MLAAGIALAIAAASFAAAGGLRLERTTNVLIAAMLAGEESLAGFHVVPLDEIFRPDGTNTLQGGGGPEGVELDSTTLADIYARQGHFGKALAVYRRLLRLMQEDAGLPVAELAERAGLSAGPCWRRIEKMERAGVILGREIDIDPRALGYEVRVFLRVVLDKAAGNAFDAFLAAYLPAVRTLRIGHPLAVEHPDDPYPALDFGPVINAAKAKELDDQVAEAIDRGAVPLHRGTPADARFLPGQPIGRIHGVEKKVGDQWVMPMYHPAAALHQGSLRKTIEDDFRKIPAVLARARFEADQAAARPRPVAQQELVASTPSAPAAPAASTSTRPTARSGSPTCRRESSPNARTTARSIATRRRRSPY